MQESSPTYLLNSKVLKDKNLKDFSQCFWRPSNATQSKYLVSKISRAEYKYLSLI